ncbi:IS1634 family transposase, partial [Liquorilactobacillus sicerae]|uniref:IS1634 family transposase n=1 Tax=Liquorilactobacillus sicerae TaxID=1416943 RepID=UPI002480EF18
MKVRKNVSRNSVSYAIIESYRDLNGKSTSRIVKSLGNENEIRKQHPNVDPYEWAKKYAHKLTLQKRVESSTIIAKYHPNKQIASGQQRSFNIGYLFLQRLYHQLDLPKVINQIQKKYAIKFDLNDIFAKLIYLRVLEPTSKRNSLIASQSLLEKMNCDQHQLYRALDVLQKESNTIQAQVYNHSLKLIPRQKSILYYDCTNYYFEIEQEDAFRKFGKSKENRPNPIVQMGLFMDASGIPLAFSIFPGKDNEQPSLQKLEKKVLKDFDLNKIIVVTDGGLSSKSNRIYNSFKNRSFITTQSIKKLKRYLKDWCLDPQGWHLKPRDQKIDLSTIDEQAARQQNLIFFKERWIKDDTGFEQHLVVTFSPRYKLYQQTIRERQFERAELKAKHPNSLKGVHQNDPKRFIKETAITKNGEIADKKHYATDLAKKQEEAKYDGFYAICTDLEDDPLELIKVNRNRWEIEETFRIMKGELRGRPVYLQRQERIEAHFLICFMALLLFRILEQKTHQVASFHEIIE